MRILFIGDIVGQARARAGAARAGGDRRASTGSIWSIANAENSRGRLRHHRARSAISCSDWGVDVMTSGNHIWDKKEALDYIGAEPRLLRPANYPAGAPGNGSYLARTRDGRSVGVVNVMGRVFMLNIDDPFAVVLREIEALQAADAGRSSSTFTPRRPRRRSRWAGTSTAR